MDLNLDGRRNATHRRCVAEEAAGPAPARAAREARGATATTASGMDYRTELLQMNLKWILNYGSYFEFEAKAIYAPDSYGIN